MVTSHWNFFKTRWTRLYGIVQVIFATHTTKVNLYPSKSTCSLLSPCPHGVKYKELPVFSKSTGMTFYHESFLRTCSVVFWTRPYVAYPSRTLTGLFPFLIVRKTSQFRNIVFLMIDPHVVWGFYCFATDSWKG